MGAGNGGIRRWLRMEWGRWLGEDEAKLQRASRQIRTLSVEAEKYKAYTYGALTEQENLRKRLQTQLVAERYYYIAPLAKDLIEIADNLARIQASMKQSLTADPATALQSLQSVLSALEMTDSALKSALRRHGIEEFSPLGESFDPKFHQSTGLLAGTITAVHKPGVKIQSTTLRPAEVTVKS